MRKLLLAAIVNALCAAAALAQQAAPLDRVPEGRRVPGWAVDEIPLNTRQDKEPINTYFGKRGLSTTSYSADSIQFYPADGNASVQYGRGLIKIDQSGEIVFSLAGSVKSTLVVSVCNFDMRISDKHVFSGQIGNRITSQSMGSINLSPGYYNIEYVLRCEYVKEAIYVIKMRGANDMGPRILGSSELFHVIR